MLTTWIIIAIVLLIVELLTQMIWTLCLAVGCIVAVVVNLSGLDAAWQVSVCGIGSVVAYFSLIPWFRKWQQRQEKRRGRDTRTGMDALPGRRAMVTEAIAGGRLGRVRIDGDSWQARLTDSDAELPVGSEVVVEAYDSNILTVSPVRK